jgi:hypothetical protein
MVLLAKHGVASVPWSEVAKWSPARRMAALIIIGESNGGRFNWNSMSMEWPK